jgi:xanthine dehydrogenase small subunit
MAGTPKRAHAVEAALLNKPWNDATIQAARDAFDVDYQPLSDWRATADYRQLTAKNLLTRFYLETSGNGQELQRFADAQNRSLAHG